MSEDYDVEPESDSPHRVEDEISFGGDFKAIEVPAVPRLEAPLPLTVKFKRLNENARVPTQGSIYSAAFDVYAIENIKLEPGETKLIMLGFAVALPQGYDMKLLQRSGLSGKGVVVRNAPGLIDEDYRGEMGVLLKYEPENTHKAIKKLYVSLQRFTKNLVSGAAFNIDMAKTKLFEALNFEPFPPYIINSGDRIGQLQVQKVVPFYFEEVEELDETDRGSGGFGSTGV